MELFSLVEKEFQVFITADRNLAFQQNPEKLKTLILVLHGRTNQFHDLKLLVPELLDRLSKVTSGQTGLVRVGAQSPVREKAEGSTWRLCPPGEYWRSAHIQPTYTRKDGTFVHEHPVSAGCCNNPSKKDQIYSEELREIARRHFVALDGPPRANDLGFKKKWKGNEFDDYIRGWTRFWNEVLKPEDPLDPNLVKALIASESGFNPEKNIKAGIKIGYARGLLQVTDSTQTILKGGDEKGELKDHLVHVTQKDMNDPCLNIAAGTRWLFHKKNLAKVRLKGPANWDHAVAEFKGVLKKQLANPKVVPKEMQIFRDYYKKLTQE